ncbi:Calx-beta domain-containing protein [Thauera sinica]|uniref:Calx-beta domain-containing protein n=1 Tax=Thauera sp. K11 TaxID=2005884 RepID=UPI000BBA4F57|nr:Calx-beta domain-containing protein [Thauera sp. K11]ATE59368.1 hypothetical protein CCZ27_04865 [Thauera sp. K11]
MPIAIEEPINTYPASGQGEPGIAGVTDAPGVPVVTLADAVVLETNSTYSPNMQFVVTLSEAATAEVRIDYRTIGKTATDGGDYDAVSGTLVVAAGQTSAVIAITTYGGSAVEFDESFVLELTNARGAQFADGAVSLRAAGTILDNDGTGAKLALLVGDAEVVEGHSGQREVVFEVRLSQPVDQAVTVNYTTAPGTASSGVDFAPVSGTLTFLAGQTVATVHVPVYGDTAVESTEQFSLVLSAPGGRVPRAWAGSWTTMPAVASCR